MEGPATLTPKLAFALAIAFNKEDTMLKRIAVALFGLLLPLQAQAAVTVVNDNVLYISGQTTTLQAARVTAALESFDIDRVVIQGPGGDFFAGLTIGHAIAREGAVVQVLTGTRCISACAFSAMGGRRLMIGGELLFHRPFLRYVDTSETIDRTVQRSEAVGVVMAAYGLNMGYDVRFIYDIARHTSPCQFIVIGSPRELEQFRNGNDSLSVTYSYRTTELC